MSIEKTTIAYFSAEIGISSSLPTYSGGLGVLAGDHIRAAADLHIPMCAITLLYREGYYKQHLDDAGVQSEAYPQFDPFPLLEKVDVSFSIQLRKRDVKINVYQFDCLGIDGHKVPIYFLDTYIEENHEDDRVITTRLYSGDNEHRILQEAILGFGGIKLLDSLGLENIATYHMNEGHCSFLSLALNEKFKFNVEKVKRHCHFTTHTPVPAGHDQFPVSQCKNILNDLLPEDLELPSIKENEVLHMTELGLFFSKSANGVSQLHGEVAQDQFPNNQIKYITNGVHHSYWISNPFFQLFDKYLPGWQKNPQRLLEVDNIPDEEIWKYHQHQKNNLMAYVNSQTQKALDSHTLTIGFARRAATYKRANLVFHDLEKLVEIGTQKIQFIFAGKAHPNDRAGKALIEEVVGNAKTIW